MKMSRRDVLAAGTTAAIMTIAGSIRDARAQPREMSADLIVHNAKVTTLQNGLHEAQAFAVRGETFVAVGSDAEVMGLRGDHTRVIDAGGGYASSLD
jgi:hypothetical protein